MPKVYIVESYDEHSYIEKVYDTREKAEQYVEGKNDGIEKNKLEAIRCYKCSCEDYSKRATCQIAAIINDWDGEYCRNEVHVEYPMYYRIVERELE